NAAGAGRPAGGGPVRLPPHGAQRLHTSLFRALARRVAGWAHVGARPEHARLVGFDRELRVARVISSPRLATPMAVAPLTGSELVVTEHTGEGVVIDTAGRLVREWTSPDIASLYAAGGGRVAATRSPYYVPQLGAPEPEAAPLIRILDTMGRPTGGLATIRRAATPLLDNLVNAGALALDAGGAAYYAPLVRDEIRKYGPGGQLLWSTKRGL